MDKSALQLALYEISISIGNSFDLDKMLNEAVKVLLSRLGCSGAAIYQRSGGVDKLCYAKPKVIIKNERYLQAYRQLLEKRQIQKTGHIELLIDGDYYYLFDLKNYGHLVLTKSTHAMQPITLHALAKINLKLVTAIRACLDHEALKFSQAKLEQTQSLAKIGSWEFDIQADKIWWSEETFNIFEIDANQFEASYEGFMDLVHPEDRDMVNDAYQKSLCSTEPYQIEHRLLFEDGRIKYVQEYGGTEYRDGQAIRSIGSVQDITERKAVEHTVSQRENELNTIIESLPLTLFVKEAKELRFVRFNAAGEKLLGRDRSELLGKNDYELFSKEHAESFIQQDRETLATGEIRSILEEEIDTPNGTKLLHTLKVPINDESGQPKYLLGISEDITERKERQASLQLSSTVIENLAEGIMICDADNRLLSVNPAFTRITGYTADEIFGRKPNILKSGRHDQSFYHEMWNTIEITGTWQGEVWNRRYNGEIYPEWLSISSIRNEFGEVTNYIGVFSDISTIKENEAELRFLAHHDPLTQLPNRVLLNDRIEHALLQKERSKGMVAIMYLDLDRFKTINDSFGHPYGDLLLQTVAIRLQDALRHEDTVSRVSGDEFVIVLEDLKSADEAGVVAQKILGVLAEPIALGEHEVTITTSIGIAMAPTDGDEPVLLLKNADAALYRAKDMGRNSFEYFSSEMSSSSFETLFMLNGLNKAIENSEFVVYYQPQVHMDKGRLTGVEALIRWLHPDLGLVPPGRFIPIAEESGMIVRLGEWVLRESCKQMKAWLDNGTPVEYVAVNLSARQLLDKNLIDMVKSALADAELAGKYLELEVTETIVMKEESYSEVLNELKALGIRISIDDFGTGYSSLVRLKHLPIDKLKIDMSFIKGVPDNEDDSNITQTIINLANSMNLSVIAEGVENEQQAGFLQNRGCLHAQGYLYSPPVPVTDFEAWLNRR